MRKLLIMLALMAGMGCAWAGDLTRQEVLVDFTATSPTNYYKVGTNDMCRGWLEEIQIACDKASVTGGVSITSVPEMAGLAASTIWTGTVTSVGQRIRPRVFATDLPAGGLTVVTNLAPQRYPLFGDTIKVAVTNVGGHTGMIYRILLKLER